MGQMLRKAISLSIIVIILSFTPGCSLNIFNKNTGSQTSYESTGASGVMNNKETVTLVFYFPGTGPQLDTQKVLDEIEKKAKTTLNIKLDFKFTNETTRHDEKVREIFSSGMQVDAYYFGKYVSASKYVDLARYDVIKDITDIFRFAAPSLYKKYSIQDLNTIKVNSKLYAIPSLVPAYVINTIQIRNDLIDKYSSGDIKTLEDYDDFLKAVKENNDSLTPVVTFPFNIRYFARMFGYAVIDYEQQLVYKLSDKETKIIPWEQTPEFKVAASYYYSWKKSGYLGSVTRQGDAASFFYQGIIFDETTHKRIILYPDKKFQHALPFTNPGFVFPHTSQNTELAIRFIDWVQQSQENYDLLIYGIEGEHFKINNEKNVLETTPDSVLYMSNHVGDVFRNAEFERLPQGYLQNYFNIMDSISYYPFHTGFYPDYTSIEKIAGDRSTQIVRKIEYPLSSGAYFPIDDIDSIIDELSTNAEIVANLVQKQFNEFKINKK